MGEIIGMGQGVKAIFKGMIVVDQGIWAQKEWSKSTAMDNEKAVGMKWIIDEIQVLEEISQKVGRWCSESEMLEIEIMGGWQFYVNDNVQGFMGVSGGKDR